MSIQGSYDIICSEVMLDVKILYIYIYNEDSFFQETVPVTYELAAVLNTTPLCSTTCI